MSGAYNRVSLIVAVESPFRSWKGPKALKRSY